MNYTALFFSVLIIYSVCVLNSFSIPVIDSVITYTYHCVDYSMGFCSRFLIGAVYNLFVRDPSPESAAVFENILLCLIYAGASFLLAKWLVKLPDEERLKGIRLALFCVTGSCALPAFARVLGMLDVFWLVFGILFLLCMQNRVLRYITPVFMFGFLLTHIGAMLTCVPLFALLLLYEYTLADTKKEKRIWLALFFVSCAVAVLSFGYFVMFEKQTLTYDIYDFNDILEQRGTKGYYYYDFALYDNNTDFTSFGPFVFDVGNADKMDIGLFVAGETKTGFGSLLHEIWFQVKLRLVYYTAGNAEVMKKFMGKLLIMLTVLSPLLVMFYKTFIARFKAEKSDKVKKFIWFCVLAFFPFTIFGSIFVSDDTLRWVTHAMLSLFTILFYISYREGSGALKVVFGFIDSFSPTVVTAYQLVYMLSVFSPYSL